MRAILNDTTKVRTGEMDAMLRKVAEVYERRADAEESLMAVNIFRSAAEYARRGRPFA